MRRGKSALWLFKLDVYALVEKRSVIVRAGCVCQVGKVLCCCSSELCTLMTIVPEIKRGGRFNGVCVVFFGSLTASECRCERKS